MEAVPTLRGPLNRADVHVSVVAVTPRQGAPTATPDALEPVWNEVDAVLTDACRQLEGLQSTSESVRLAGPPAPSLLDYAEQHRADLIMIGSRGFGPIRRLLVGSVSRAVATRAPCSVLVVRPQPLVWHRVLVGFDESPDIDAGLAILCAGDPPSDARVTLVRVVRDRAPFPRSMQTRDGIPETQIARRALHDITRQAELKLAIAKRRLLAAGWAHVDPVIEVAHPAAQLNLRLQRDSPDLVVLGAVGRRGIRMHAGSVSDRLLQSAPCSVLIARPGPAPLASE